MEQQINVNDFGAANINTANVHNGYSQATWDSVVNHIVAHPGSHIINVTGDFSFADTTGYTFANAANIEVSIRGGKTITLASNGNLLQINQSQAVVLRETVFQGKSGNNAPLVGISGNGGTFIMKSGAIIGNDTLTAYSGVYNSMAGTFTMSGGEISGNTVTSGSWQHSGGGVYNERIFRMSGGKINGNISGSGGVYNDGGFVMAASSSASITGNEPPQGRALRYPKRCFIRIGGSFDRKFIIPSGLIPSLFSPNYLPCNELLNLNFQKRFKNHSILFLYEKTGLKFSPVCTSFEPFLSYYTYGFSRLLCKN